MDRSVQDAIVQGANEAGEDPAFALAVADRESGGDPEAHASRTIYGLFQMSGPNRARYGGDSSDPYAQTKGWTGFIGDTRKDMATRLGRDPTNEETYLGHYFGAGRAARMISGQIGPDTDVHDVFTPQEIAANPEFAKAGTVGKLMTSVEGDIGRRIGNYSGNYPVKTGPNFAAYGQTPTPAASAPFNSAAFGVIAQPAPIHDEPPITEAQEEPQPNPLAAEAAVEAARHMPAPSGPEVAGVAGVPGLAPQSAAPLPQAQRGAQLQRPQLMGPPPGTAQPA